MLSKVVDFNGKNWDQLLPHALFSILKYHRVPPDFPHSNCCTDGDPGHAGCGQGCLGAAAVPPAQCRGARGTDASPNDPGVARCGLFWEHMQQAQAQVYNRGAQVRVWTRTQSHSLGPKECLKVFSQMVRAL